MPHLEDFFMYHDRTDNRHDRNRNESGRCKPSAAIPSQRATIHTNNHAQAASIRQNLDAILIEFRDGAIRLHTLSPRDRLLGGSSSRSVGLGRSLTQVSEHALMHRGEARLAHA